MKIPKCPKTVSGEHRWIEYEYGMTGFRDETFSLASLHGEKKESYTHSVPEYGWKKIEPYCKLCGLIDDRKE